MPEPPLKSVVKTDSPKYLEARNSLPEDLRSIYDELVADYASFTFQTFGKGYVAYKVLAELVRQGWRPTNREA